MTRFTVHSDGYGKGTVVLNEDGEEVKGIAGVSIQIDANGLAELTMEAAPVEVNVGADKAETRFYCPLCNRVETHQCKTPMADLPINFGYRLCNKTKTIGGKINCCMINKDVVHTQHFDTKYGVSWS